MKWPLPVRPFDDFEVDLDLSQVIQAQSHYGEHNEIALIDSWIGQGFVAIGVAAMSAIIGPKPWPGFDAYMDRARGGNVSDWHRQLCATAAMCLEALGKTVEINGHGVTCHYSAGIADARIFDEDFFVECGTITSARKLRIALEHRETVMIVPYGYGGAFHKNKGLDLGFIFEPISVPKPDLFKNNAGRGLV